MLGDDIILEHHPAIEEEKLEELDRNGRLEGKNKLRLAMEDWAAPIIVTTNVQLFESLFAAKPSRCRKLHSLANALIVLDEAQTIPLPVLRPCVAALDELVRNYGCSIVLCTATQPALAAPDFKGGFGIGADRELAPNPPALHEKLRRVTLRVVGEKSDPDLVAALADHRQALVIVNSRAHALKLYTAAKEAGLEGLVHPSTRQVASDRSAILGETRDLLPKRAQCRVIATSLVEAGVDLDFPVVFRAEAGLDQIMQAAGSPSRRRVGTPPSWAGSTDSATRYQRSSMARSCGAACGQSNAVRVIDFASIADLGMLLVDVAEIIQLFPMPDCRPALGPKGKKRMGARNQQNFYTSARRVLRPFLDQVRTRGLLCRWWSGVRGACDEAAIR